MTWNDKTQSYRGETSNGKIVDVAGDEWSEALTDGIQSYIDNQSHVDLGGEKFEGNPEALLEQYPALYENYENLTLIELGDADMWAGLAGDNPNVEIIEA
jgi:hypothetical protein